MIIEYYTHQLTHLHHLHEAWCQRIHERTYKETGTVLTMGTLSNHLIFKEFLSSAEQVLRLHTPTKAEGTTSWATLVRPGIASGWHDHKSHKWILVYYPQDQTDMGDLLIGEKIDDPNPIRITPREGLCVMYPAETMHKIDENTSNKIRYSLVMLSNVR